jgi:hypothetical protein
VAAERRVAESHRGAGGKRSKRCSPSRRCKRRSSTYASYLGNGSPRFYLPLDQQLFNDNFAQFVVTSHDIAAREDLKRRLEQRFADPAASGAACARACCASRTARRSVFRCSSAFPARTSASCDGLRPKWPR